MHHRARAENILPLALVLLVAALAVVLVGVRIIRNERESTKGPDSKEMASQHSKEAPAKAGTPGQETTPSRNSSSGGLTSRGSEGTEPPPQQENAGGPDSQSGAGKGREARAPEKTEQSNPAVSAGGTVPAKPAQSPPQAQLQEERAKWEKCKSESNALQSDGKFAWALQKLETARDECPNCRAEILQEISLVSTLLKDAVDSFDRQLALAREDLGAGKPLASIRHVVQARGFLPDMPEKHQEASALVRKIKDAALNTSMVRIPRRAFILGDSADPEYPRRQAQNRSFLMDATEVTLQTYALYLADTGREPPPQLSSIEKAHPFDKVLAAILKNLPEVDQLQHATPGRPHVSAASSSASKAVSLEVVHDALLLPIHWITLAEAEGFARWAGKRLPSEEEWERAARFVDGRSYPWGENWLDAEGRPRANAVDTVSSDRIGLRPVRSFPNGASPEGVYDLAGNVWEWTASSVRKTVDGRETFFHVLKGGSFMTPKETCRGSVRLVEDPDVRQMDVGFRCVKDAD